MTTPDISLQDASASLEAQMRPLRPHIADLVARCRASILAPADDQSLSRALRLALATRVARKIGATALANAYRADLEALAYLPIADGAAPDQLATPRLAAIARHADRLTAHSAEVGAADLDALESAGLDAGAIVALTQIVAFANFEARVALSLAALGISGEPSA